MKIKLKPTERGFIRGEFLDTNGEECSIQESSIADDDRIWLGQNKGTHHQGECLARMHIDREQAIEIARLLYDFARTGRLIEHEN